MSAPDHIKNHIQRYISRHVVPALPAEIQLVSFEVVSWLITVHMYQRAVFSDLSASSLEDHIKRLVADLPPRDGEPWEVVPSYHRRDPNQPYNPEGEVVYAV
jgi:hypothetical protein